ncbi:MAG TPA: Nramp family divalent metal transporter [Planctomycetaceae bacterium]|nr:Nramp family divalent metal transporter [Planctomycetaceae bacterium]
MSESTDRNDGSRPPMPFGELPPWGRDDLPAPLPFSLRNLFRTIGPGAILLAASIGGGEWLVGPAISVQHGTGILWIATVAIALQLVVNLEGIRYTLYTGEPILVGVMRLRPGSVFWAGFYILLSVAQLGIPSLAAACASVLFASFAGRLAGIEDTATLQYISYGVILLGVGILLSGRTIERMLEYVSWVMITFILSFLLAVNALFVPWSHWGETLAGFFQFGTMPADMDPLLLGAFAATAGSGGVGNLVISNWFRDKGFGMGATVGAISGAFSRHEIPLSPVGKVFPITIENLRRWRGWWRYVCADQVWLWGGGCFVGMFLNVNLATYVIPPGTDLDHMAAGAFQAQYMAEQLWSGFWVLALLNGFWVLFSTHLGNTDVLVRIVTDMLWVSSPRVRRPGRMSISRLYYLLLGVFTVWGLISVNWGHAMTLFKILGVVAGPVLAIAAVQILRVNTRLLPEELRPPLWRRAVLVLCALFYGALAAAQLWDAFAD